MNDAPVRVLVVDDHPMLREGLKRFFEQTQDIRVSAEAATAKEAIAAIAGRAMDVVLLDLSLPDGKGLALLEHIKRHAAGLPIIVYTMFSDAEYARTAFAAGASGYLNKDNPAEELVLAIRRVARGGRYVSAAMADILLGGAEEPKAGMPHEQLSQREREVLLAIAKGISLTAIAETMHLSVKTVSTYRARILAKLGASSNVQMTRYVLEHKLER